MVAPVGNLTHFLSNTNLISTITVYFSAKTLSLASRSLQVTRFKSLCCNAQLTYENVL